MGQKAKKEIAKNLQLFFITLAVFVIIALFALALNWIQASLTQKNHSKNVTPTAQQEDETVSINSTWNKYTNKKFGFSLIIPKTMIHPNGSCEWVSVNDHSYRPIEAAIPVKVFRTSNTVYISSEYYYKLTGETVKGSSHYFSGCQRIDNSLNLLADSKNHYEQFWAIETASVNNETQLEDYIKQNYGEGCHLGQKKESNQMGVYDISIETDVKKLDTSSCPVNFSYQIKYYPIKNRVASWNIGQSCTFRAKNNVCRDEEMTKSFKFN